MARSAKPAATRIARNHHAIQLIAYVFAVVIGLGLLPIAFSVSDGATVLRVSNDLLDLVSR